MKFYYMRKEIKKIKNIEKINQIRFSFKFWFTISRLSFQSLCFIYFLFY